MSHQIEKKGQWQETLRVWLQPKVLTMLFLGFSAGIPILLIFSTLSVWLREAGVSRSVVTFFSWAALGYSFKFIWAPIIDKMPLPLLTPWLGRRRAWLLVSQLLVIIAIVWMGCTNPAESHQSIQVMAFAAVLLGFSSATQDIVIDAYRIESADESYQAILSSMYVAGYRIGMLVAGAGSLVLASHLGTTIEQYNYQAWMYTYLAMAAVMGIGVLTTLVIREPEVKENVATTLSSVSDYLRFLAVFFVGAATFGSAFFFSAHLFELAQQAVAHISPVNGTLLGFVVGTCRFVCALVAAYFAIRLVVLTGMVEQKMVQETYIAPVQEFIERYNVKTSLLLLLLIGFYRLSDVVLGVISNVFYVDMEFSKNVIAGVTKTFGLFMTIAGGFLGGAMAFRYGVYRVLFCGALLSAATNLLFMLLAQAGPDTTLLTLVIAADNLSGGLAATAFVAFLSSLTNISFTAVQYAIFSSMMTLFPKLIGGYSGTFVKSFGYEKFFLTTALMGVPVLALVWWVKTVMEARELRGE